MRGATLLLLLVSVPCAASDSLAAIQELLSPLRGAAQTDTRGATAALTDVKHQLRDWIEGRLAAMQFNAGRWTPDPAVLQEQLNDELDRAGLFCPANAACGENPLGYLHRVGLKIQSGFLIVRTSVGIQICGEDDSAYIYQATGNGWRRIWQSEQTDYDAKKYTPQALIEVKISPTDWRPESDHSEHLIVTTGTLPW